MGLSLEFYAGDAAIIGADFSAIDFSGIRNGTRAEAYVDFSLHLSPIDLDLLSVVIAECIGVAPIVLNDCLIRTVGGIDDEGSADVVDPAWVRLIASADESKAADLAADWMHRVGARCNQETWATPDAVNAIRNLIHLCQTAVRKEVDVVQTWYL